MKQRVGHGRLWAVFVVIALLFGVVSWRLFDVSIRRHAWYAQTSDAQAQGVSNVLVRGNLYLAAGSADPFLVATNRKFPVLLITPRSIPADDRATVTESLVAITGLTADAVLRAVSADTSGTRPLMRKLTDDQVRRIIELKRTGVTVGYETDRSYPAGTLAADVIGFLGYGPNGRAGQYGVESGYEQELTGKRGSSFGSRWDVIGQVKRLFGWVGEDATDDQPNDIELTIDKNVQAYAEGVLESVLQRYNAASGVLIVQEPSTGRILAMADSPSYDPNVYGTFPPEAFLNAALQPFEPGSSFKPFTMAAGLDLGVITPDTTFDDAGDMVIDGYTIKNFNEGRFGRVTMTTVLEKSINTGVMWVQQKVGNERFLDYAINLGFGQKTTIDLPGEAAGDLNNLYSGRRINYLTASFGQGITVTPIQLVTAYSAIANGGKLMRPMVVRASVDDRGKRTERAPEVLGTPFSTKTAATLRSMLTSVVDRGFDKARIARYDVAGKTGTAQIASPNGGYLEGEYNHSFVGFAPASDPRFTILIRMEKPKGITFAADSLSPVFKEMALFMLNYLAIPPTR